MSEVRVNLTLPITLRKANLDVVEGVPIVEANLRVSQPVRVPRVESDKPSIVGEEDPYGVTVILPQLGHVLDRSRPHGNVPSLTALQDLHRGANRNLRGGVHVCTYEELSRKFNSNHPLTKLSSFSNVAHG